MSHLSYATLAFAAGRCDAVNQRCEARIAELLRMCDELEKRSESIVDASMREELAGFRRRCEALRTEISGFNGLTVDKKAVGSNDWLAKREEDLRYLGAAVVTAGDLSDQAERIFGQRMDEAAHQVHTREGLDEYLAGVGNARVAGIMRMLARNRDHDGLSMDELRDMAEHIADPSLPRTSSMNRRVVQKAAADLREAKLPAEMLETGSDAPVSPMDILRRCDTAVMDESVRKSAISAIAKSVSSLGFIVDPRNIRLIREDNLVTISAQKPGGQRAEFSVSLDGRFVYKFDGYEGLACEKDIDAMTADLEKVYGIKTEDTQVVWSNPDKKSNMYHAEMKVRRQ